MTDPQLSTSTLGPYSDQKPRKHSAKDAVRVDLRELFGGCSRPHVALIGSLKSYLSHEFPGQLQRVGHLKWATTHPEYEVLLLWFESTANTCYLVAELKQHAIALHDTVCHA